MHHNHNHIMTQHSSLELKNNSDFLILHAPEHAERYNLFFLLFTWPSGGDIDHQFWRNFENIAEKSADLLDEIHN